MPLILRTVKGSPLTIAELDGNLQYLESLNAALPPVTITGTALTLNAADHANRLLICTNASPVLLSLSDDSTGGWDSDDSINVLQSGTGAVTIIAGTATLRSPPGTTAVTTARYKLTGSTRIGANEWTLTETVASGGGASASGRANNRSFIIEPQTSIGSGLEARSIHMGQILGTGSSSALTGTNRFTEKNRRTLTSAATVDTPAGILCDRGNMFASQYFSFELEFGFNDTSTDTRNMYGFANATTGLTGGTLFTDNYQGGKIMVGNHPGEANLSIFYANDTGLGAALQIPLGSDFPTNTQASVTGIHYRFRVDYYPASDLGGRRIVYTMTNLGTDVVASSTLISGIPNVTENLMLIMQRSTSASTTPVSLAIMYAAAGAYL